MKKLIFNNNTLIVKKDSIVQKHIKFNGKIIAGMYSNFWGNLEAIEIHLGKNCYVGGLIKCKKAIIGAYTRFNSINAEDVILLNKCKGNFVKGNNVIVGENSKINEIFAENLLLIGNSRLKRFEARKIVALKF